MVARALNPSIEEADICEFEARLVRRETLSRESKPNQKKPINTHRKTDMMVHRPFVSAQRSWS